jgi:general secretion pathway protein E/type IV pilus assembly protein PilB
VASFPRLQDIGIKDSIMTRNIIGIVAQRLIRCLCNNCKQAYEADGLERKLLNIRQGEKIFESTGCDSCYQSGYKGRHAILEVLRIDNAIDDLIAKSATPHEIENKARENGFRSLADEGIAKVIDGTTSVEELSRIVDLTHRLN